MMIPFKKNDQALAPEGWLVAGIGFTSMSAQLILLRDFLRLFQGNELVIGLLLASWMFITALGAWSGYRFRKLRGRLYLLFFLLAWLPPLTHFFLIILRHLFFLPGVMTGLLPILGFSWLVLLPFCFLSGLSFPVFSEALSARLGNNSINRVYYLEASGALAGGALFSFILVFLFPNWKSLLLISLLDMVLLGLAGWKARQRTAVWGSAAGFSVLLTLLALTDMGQVENRLLFPGQEVVMQRESPHGSLTLTRQYEQWQLYENNQLLYASGNPASPEEKVHFPLSRQDDPDTLLLVFGSWNGMLHEVAKYHPKKVDAVEINRDIVRILQPELPEISAPWLSLHIKDPVMFAEKGEAGFYDAILVNAPSPSNLQTNRYFTHEFFLSCKRILQPDGVFSISLPASGNYLGEFARKNHSILFFTLKEVFEQVVIVPGEQDYFIASDHPFDWEITGVLDERKLENEYVNPYYLSEDLLKRRSELIHSALDPGVRLNTGLHPVATFNQWQQWLSHFRISHSLLPVLFMLLILTTLVRMNPVQVVMFSGGFASAALEVILLLTFQVLFGYLYLVTGMLITLFMLGLFLGSRHAGREIPSGKKNFTAPLKWLALVAVSIPLLIAGGQLSWFPHALVPVITGTVTLWVAWLVGTLFARGTRELRQDISRTSGSLYSADLLGSALGAMLVSAVLIPMTGMLVTCLLTAMAALAGLFWFRFSGRPGS